MQSPTTSHLNKPPVSANPPAKPKLLKSDSQLECNAINLAEQLHALLAKQTIEIVLQFYTAEIVGMIEKIDPELRATIRQAATHNPDIAELCKAIDLEDGLASSR